ncbi:hypothetical protein [Lentilactobacillus kefiri]|uniref:hypothetical protein n=1 Tax=Lentilactobacillus kefiri TaxID=33962 RepID=UPI00345EDF80
MITTLDSFGIPESLKKAMDGTQGLRNLAPKSKLADLYKNQGDAMKDIQSYEKNLRGAWKNRKGK